MSLLGNISEIPLSDLIQVNANNQRTCMIRFKGSGTQGAIYFRQGVIIHALLGNLVGNQAVHALLTHTDLKFEVKRIKTMPNTTVTKGWKALLLEAAQFQDENTRPGQEPPPTAAVPWW